MDIASETTQFLSPVAASTDGASAYEEYAANPRFQSLQTELRSLLFEGVSTVAPSYEQQHDLLQTDVALKARQTHQKLLETLTSSQTGISLNQLTEYLKIWIAECAPWLDMFDQERTFGLQVPILAQNSSAVLFALLALSARHSERQKGIKNSHDSLELYQKSIASITPSLNPKDPRVLVTACILCVLEMMSVSPQNWRRHSEGCAALFQVLGVNGFSGGLLQAVFWCYARMDLCAAIIADGAESTILPIGNWILLQEEEFSPSLRSDRNILIQDAFLTRGRRVPDMHANYSVYICAKVYDLLTRRTRYLELGEDNGCQNGAYEIEWQQLWSDLKTWYDKRPPALLPAKHVSNITGNNSFPAILFLHPAAISSNQLYHTASILMLEIRPKEVDISEDPNISSALWHARRVIGISLTNSHKGSLNNAIQPLFVAGRLFSHREEHKVIVNILLQIEALTSWGSRWRIRDLETCWGYPRGTFT